MSSSLRRELFNLFIQHFSEDEIILILGNWHRYTEINIYDASSEELINEARLVLEVSMSEEFSY